MASREDPESTPDASNSLPRMFYCYQCRARTSPDAEHIENFTCMQCGSGFIEDITIREDSPSSNSDDQSYDDLDPMIGETIGNLLENLQGLERLDREYGRSDSSERGRRPRGHRAHQVSPSDQFIQSLLTNLIGGVGRGGMPPGSIHIATSTGGGAGMPGGFFTFGTGPGGGPVPMMPLYGNPGDYAWGRGGLDAIVTQLLNQMEGTGPPPMNIDEIKKIPTIKVDQTHLDAKAQCSVCWDDFKLDEEVRQLKCDHIFHENCIIPWLELHNTCPVCRKEQEDVPKEGSAGSEAASGAAGAGSGVRISFNTAAAAPNTSGSTPSTSSSTSATASGTGQVHTGTVTPAEQLAATLGSAISAATLGSHISMFNQIFGVPSQGSQMPAPSASSTSANSTSSVTSSTTSSATSTSTTSSSPSSSSSQSRTRSSGGQGENNSTSGFQDMDLE